MMMTCRCQGLWGGRMRRCRCRFWTGRLKMGSEGRWFWKSRSWRWVWSRRGRGSRRNWRLGRRNVKVWPQNCSFRSSRQTYWMPQDKNLSQKFQNLHLKRNRFRETWAQLKERTWDFKVSFRRIYRNRLPKVRAFTKSLTMKVRRQRRETWLLKTNTWNNS